MILLAEDIAEGVIDDQGGVKVTAFEVDHQLDSRNFQPEEADFGALGATRDGLGPQVFLLRCLRSGRALSPGCGGGLTAKAVG